MQASWVPRAGKSRGSGLAPFSRGSGGSWGSNALEGFNTHVPVAHGEDPTAEESRDQHLSLCLFFFFFKRPELVIQGDHTSFL